MHAFIMSFWNIPEFEYSYEDLDGEFEFGFKKKSNT